MPKSTETARRTQVVLAAAAVGILGATLGPATSLSQASAAPTQGSVAPVLSPSVIPAPGRCGDPVTRPWCDLSLTADQRADLLLARMTVPEKVSLLGGEDPKGVLGKEGTHTGTSRGIERLGIPTMYLSDGPVGPRQGKATGMPSPMSIASSFSTSIARTDGAVIGNEVKLKGNDVVYAPGVNILRTPLNGRTFEYFGEDPFLAARLSTAFIRGVQGEGVMGNVKHYAANNQEGVGFTLPGIPIGPGIGSRLTVDVRVDERTLREIYLPAFESAVKKANVATVMCAYPRVNGQYACENRHLLTKVLKGDWGFKGFVLTDYGAAKNPVASLNNGLDLDIFPGVVLSPAAVGLALTTGLVSVATLNEHVHRILRTMFAYGMFDRDAYVDDTTQIDQAAHHEQAARLEAEGIVLLENRGQLLPLDAGTLGTLAVIGPEADAIKDGGGSSAINEFQLVTPLAALRERLGATRVVYDDGKDPARAAAVAAAADAAVVVVGDAMTEGNDKLQPTLNSGQTDGIDRDALVARIAAAQPRTVAVLQSGGPVLLPFRDKVGALLEMWYPGQNGGTALARVLFGDVDPGGRLPATFPAAAGDLPTAGDPTAYPGVLETVQYKEGVLVGYRHYDAKNLAVAYPFGHGLSYTQFDYSAPVITPTTGPGAASVTFDVTNTGTRPGSTVPQLYVGMPEPRAGVVQPPRQLKEFTKLELAPGETRTVTLRLGKRDFSYWDVAADGWRVADGCYRIELGTSSRDIDHEAVAAWGATCAAGSVTVR